MVACQNALFGLVVAIDAGWISFDDARSRLLATIIVNLQVNVAFDPELAARFGTPEWILAGVS